MKHGHLGFFFKSARAIYGGYSSALCSFFVLFATDQWASAGATMYGSQKNHYTWLKCHENENKIDNDYVLRYDHRIKTTRPISMILLSFFSEYKVLSDEINICYIFDCQSNENRAFCSFFWDTRYFSHVANFPEWWGWWRNATWIP